LSLAANGGETTPPAVLGAAARTKNSRRDVIGLLAEARQRLQSDAQQAAAPAPSNPDYAAQRQALRTILSQRAYLGATKPAPQDWLVEWIDSLLDRLFTGLVHFGSHAPWIVWLLRVLVYGGIGTALVWFLVRIEWRSRLRVVPDDEPAPGAPSARAWQQWLKDARAMADKAEWREAIHLLYWASIARLESMRLWPADSARTPREYLRLLAGADPRKPTLTALTRSFERTWYGGRPAAAADFDVALKQASTLGVKAE
jgi:hypothetical protein